MLVLYFSLGPWQFPLHHSRAVLCAAVTEDPPAFWEALGVVLLLLSHLNTSSQPLPGRDLTVAMENGKY